MAIKRDFKLKRSGESGWKMSKKTKGTVCGMEKPQHGGSKILNQKKTQNLRGFNTSLATEGIFASKLALKRTHN